MDPTQNISDAEVRNVRTYCAVVLHLAENPTPDFTLTFEDAYELSADAAAKGLCSRPMNMQDFEEALRIAERQGWIRPL